VRPLLAALLLVGGTGFGVGAPGIDHLEIVPLPDVSFASPSLIPVKPGGTVRVDLELGDSLDGLILRLQPAARLPAGIVVEQSFETSLTVMEEGPHLDLLNWKHYHAPWQPLEKVNATDFRIRPITAAESRKFPKVTPAEIQAVVTREGGARLGKYVAAVEGPNDPPCAVGVSKIRFRIKVKDKVITTVEFLVPMGC
jgi:hypothetical protein